MAFPAIVAGHGGTSTTTSITIVAAAAGNVLVLLGGARRSPQARTISSISTTNVTWTNIGQQTNSHLSAELWLGVVAGGASGTTVTVTMSGSGSTQAFTVVEFSGVLVTGTILGAAAVGNTGSDTTPTIGSFTGLQNASLLIAVEVHENGTGPSASPGGSWVNLTFLNNSTTLGEKGAYVLDGTAASLQSASWTIGSADWSTVIGELLSQTLRINVSDSSTATESVSETVVDRLSVNDASTVTENVSLAKIFTVNVNDSSTITESITAAGISSLSVNDSSTYTEDFASFLPTLIPNPYLANTWSQSFTGISRTQALVYRAGFIYFASWGDTPAKFVKVDVTNPSSWTSFNFPNDGLHINPVDMIYDPTTDRMLVTFLLGFLLVSAVDYSAMSSADVINDSTNLSGSAAGLDVDGTYLYVGMTGSGAAVGQYKLSDWSFQSKVNTITGHSCTALHYDGSDIYVSTYSLSTVVGGVAKVATTNPVTLSSSQVLSRLLPCDDFNFTSTHIWIGFEDGSGAVNKIAKSNLASVTEILTGQLADCYCIHNDGAYVLASYSNAPGRLVRINPDTSAFEICHFGSGYDAPDELVDDGANLYATYWITPTPLTSSLLSDAHSVTEVLGDACSTSESVSLSIVSGTTPTISVVDSATVTESVSISVITEINVNDTSTTSENITLFVSTQLMGVTDSSTVTESITVVVADLPSVSDSSTIAENVVLVIATTSSVNDTSTVTESVVLQVQTACSVSDSSVVTENVDLTIASALQISVFDAVTLSESATTSALTAVSVSDVISTVENTTEVIFTSVDVSDAGAVTDVATFAAAEVISVTDSSGVVEAVTIGPVIDAAVSDAVTAAESVAAVVVDLPAVNDAVTTAEDLVVQTVALIAVEDSVTTAESIADDVQTFIDVNDSSSVSEIVLFPGSAVQVSEVDNVTASENVQVRFEVSIGVNDNSVTDEAIVVEVVDELAVNDTVTGTDVTTEIVITQLGVSDNVATAENVEFNIPTGGAVQATDNIAVVETVSLTIQTELTASDNSSVAENTALSVTEQVSVSDAATVNDSAALTVQVGVAVNDSSTVAENVQGAIGTQRAISDSAAVVENVALVIGISASVNDAAAATEQITEVVLTDAVVNDSTTTTENIQVVVGNPGVVGVSVVDSSTVSDAVSIAIENCQISVNDQSPVTEEVSVINLGVVTLLQVFDSCAVAETLGISAQVIVNAVDLSAVSDSVVFDFGGKSRKLDKISGEPYMLIVINGRVRHLDKIVGTKSELEPI